MLSCPRLNIAGRQSCLYGGSEMAGIISFDIVLLKKLPDDGTLSVGHHYFVDGFLFASTIFMYIYSFDILRENITTYVASLLNNTNCITCLFC